LRIRPLESKAFYYDESQCNIKASQVESSRGGSSRKFLGALALDGVDCRAPENTTAQQLKGQLALRNLYCMRKT